MLRKRTTLASKCLQGISIIGKRNANFASVLDILLNLALFVFFRFKFWHVLATPYRRPYKKDLRLYLASLEGTQFIELGVGLGDNLWGISNAFGLERDMEVIRAAKNKNPNVCYKQFEFGINSLSDQIRKLPKFEKRILIAVNVLTGAEIPKLEEELSILWGKELHFLIIDIVNEDYEHRPSHNWMPKKSDFTLIQVNDLATNDKYRKLVVFTGTKND